MLIRPKISGLGLAICLVLTASVACAGDLLGLIPADAHGFVVVNRLAETDAKLQTLAGRMKLPMPSPLALLKDRGGLEKGIDEQGSAAVALVPSGADGGGYAAVICVPVSDFAAFLAQLQPGDEQDKITAGSLMGRPVVVGQKDGHALLTWPNDRDALAKMLGGEPGDDGPFGSFLDDQDAGVVVTASGVQMLTGLGQRGLAQLKETLAAIADEENPAVAAIEIYVQLLAALGAEVDSLAIGLRYDDDGNLRLANRTRFQATGQIAPLLRDAQPYRGDLLAGLPQMPLVGVFAGALPPKAWEPMMEMSGNMMKAVPEMYGLEPEQIDKMIELSKQSFTGVRGMSFALGVGRPGAPLYSEMLAAIRVDDAQDYLKVYRKYWDELQELIGDTKGSIFSDMELQAVKVAGKPALKVTMDMAGMMAAGALPNAEEVAGIMDKLFGPGGKMVVHMAAVDDHTVLMAYTDTVLLEKALQSAAAGQGLAQSDDVARTAKLLPTDVHGIGFWSPSGTIAFANRMIQLMSDAGDGPQLPDFPDTPAIGWTVKATAEGIEKEAVIPAELCTAIGEYVETVKQEMNDGN